MCTLCRLYSLPIFLLIHRYILLLPYYNYGVFLRSFVHEPLLQPPCPEPLRKFSLAAPPFRRSLYDASGNRLLLYLASVACTAPSIPDPNLAQMLMLPQASVSVAHATNRIHLNRSRRIIYPMPTGQTPGALYWSTRKNAIINQMSAQVGVIVC